MERAKPSVLCMSLEQSISTHFQGVLAGVDHLANSVVLSMFPHSRNAYLTVAEEESLCKVGTLAIPTCHTDKVSALCLGRDSPQRQVFVAMIRVEDKQRRILKEVSGTSCGRSIMRMNSPIYN